MAPITGKRSQSHENVKGNKRQRIHTTKPRSKTVTLDSLPWNEVSLPDRLEDAEGLLGLEEVDGVDLVKDTETGRLECRVGKGSPCTYWNRVGS